jgi:hypothetical protein
MDEKVVEAIKMDVPDEAKEEDYSNAQGFVVSRKSGRSMYVWINAAKLPAPGLARHERIKGLKVSFMLDQKMGRGMFAPPGGVMRSDIYGRAERSTPRPTPSRKRDVDLSLLD